MFLSDHSERLMQILNLEIADVGRYRDCYLNHDATEIIIFTRNGGGNRNHYHDSEYEECDDCLGCLMQYEVPSHPNYLRDEDDNFDGTYALIYYSIPPEYSEECRHMAIDRALQNIATNPD